MLRRCLTAAVLLALTPMAAMADPVGIYDVVGTNPDNGGEYKGTAEVKRTGDTYSVTWSIGGSDFVGTGLGAKFVSETRFETGLATPDDIAISVGYVANNTFGVAMYFEQPDGQWEGVWTYGGSTKATTEKWFRKK
ncbi:MULTISPECIES: hypothetical protein [unclassified Rhizobium]|uniref:hypothetical protein n=1 Tax=unclassified Rhizobium TaxID=2613769 RepID=UPI0007135AE8|nr:MULTISPECIES: hypothetical protein [unclassified Rhizobium]KQS86655.1 hypothetical protein ASG50_28400 [Rhizobium sp. Leaf386]KQS94090.1 hypothetical protein ASG42_30470 [Rhizobium sp. Leaf391]KQT99311.1 hypothetical protein ASG68_29885 [Rhizobium sp. Leaf453]